MAPPKTALSAVRAARAGWAATAVATPPTLAAAAEAGSPVPAAPDPMHIPAPEAGGSRVLQGALEAPSFHPRQEGLAAAAARAPAAARALAAAAAVRLTPA